MFWFLISLFIVDVQAASNKRYRRYLRCSRQCCIWIWFGNRIKRTGDTIRNEATIRTLAKRLQGLGVTLTVEQIRARNVAVVMVTGTLPVTARAGQRIDVEVSSAGDALSLEGGVLQLTPLLAADGEAYGIAQGPLVLGGFSVEQNGSVSRKNHTTTGRIPQGGIVEKENANRLVLQEQVQINYLLRKPDFTTALRMVEVINGELGEGVAVAVDQGAVAVSITDEYQNNVVALVAAIENLEVEVDTPTKVVINERTGTVVMGSNVRISEVAVAHGGLSIEIDSEPVVSQPNALGGGATFEGEISEVDANEGEGELTIVGGATIGDLVNALNGLGVTPRDLVQIYLPSKQLGALQAELEVL